MRLPHRATASVLASALLLSGLAACTSSSDSGDGQTLVIGADLDNSSSVDQAYARALQLRIDQLNASGQLGKRKLAVQIVDNHSDPTTASRDITTFADNPNVVAVITGHCDDCTITSVKAINDKQIPVIALAASDEVASPASGRKFIFKLGPNSVDSAATMVSELSRTKVASVGIVYATGYYGSGAEKAYTAELDKNNIDAVATKSVKSGATDVSQAVGAVADAKPDALVVLTDPDQAALVATTAKQAGFKGKLYFDAAAAGNQFISSAAASGAMNDATMVFTQILAIDDVIATTPAKAARKQWFRDYTARYGTYSGVAAFAADGADLVADAVSRAGSDRSRIRDIIETSQIDGYAGPIRLTPDNHSGLMPQALTLLVARNGQWRLAS